MADPRFAPRSVPVDDGASAHPAPAQARVPLAALWFGIFGAPVAWSVQTLVDLPVASHGCYPQLYPLAAPATAGLRGIVFGVSLAMLLVCLAAAGVAWRAWRRTRGEHQASSGRGREHGPESALLETGEGRTRFMALAGVLTSVTFTVLCLAHAAGVFVVAPCGR